jgi:hypothetical protein
VDIDAAALPSLEEIKNMEKQRIRSLEISNDSVKCQMCGMAAPIVGRLPTPYRNRITLLKHRIDWLQSHPRLKDSINSINQLKQELAELLEQEAKADKLRCLPLYSCRTTGWKFICSKCYDMVYTYAKVHEVVMT